MEEKTVLYYDGLSARPAEVRVLFSNEQLHLYEGNEEHLIQNFALAGMSYNEVGKTHYVYLDSKGLQYLQFTSDHPLAASLPQKVADANPHWGQKLMKQRLVVLVPLTLLLCVGVYFLLMGLVPFLGMRMIGVQQEIVMGDKLKEVMLKETDLLGSGVDAAGSGKLQAFADKLKLSSTYPIRLTLVNSNIVNAYALPGGQVVVYKGLLDKIDSPEALAALLAHESSHVNERHSLRSLLRSAASGLIVAVIFNDATGISGALVGNANTLNGLRYSRSLEAEADQKAMEILRKNDVSLRGMQRLMEVLQNEGDIRNSLSFLSTHPLTKERIVEADKYIQSYPREPAERNDLKEIFISLKE